MNVRKALNVPIHPILIALFPVLSFVAYNITEIEPGDFGRVLVGVLVGVSGLCLLLRLFLRDWARASLITSVVVILFFSYGHIYNLVKQVNITGFEPGRHRYLVPVNIALIVLSWFQFRKMPNLSAVTRGINAASVALLIYPLFQIVSYRWEFQNPVPTSEMISEPRVGVNQPLSKADVYYIILDAYTRDDTMLSFYEFDNSAFLQALEQRGFYIAYCSQSNYSRTHLSLGSTLNMNFIQEIYPRKDDKGLAALVQENVVRKQFGSWGYSVIGFDTAYPHTQWDDASVYYSYKDVFTTGSLLFGGMSEFEALFFKTTAGMILLDVDTLFKFRLHALAEDSPKRDRHIRVEYNLDSLETVPELDSPKFIFAHINTPHDPYIFSRTGAFLPDQEDYIPGYRDQVIYINTRVLSIVDNILAQSDPPPIIVLQGDHGGTETQNDHRRMHILNAYYLPSEGSKGLYPEISPINTFRLIFDTYFGTNYGLLPDTSYYSHWKTLFDFEVVPINRPGCETQIDQ